MRFYNQNHYLGKQAKTLSGFDALSKSNRKKEIAKVASLSQEYNEIIHSFIQKTARDINECVIEKQASSSASFDLVSQAAGLVSQKLGVDPQNSQSIVSNLLQKVSKIQEMYGGDQESILRRLVEEMQNTMSEETSDPVGEAQLNMGGAFKYQKTEDQIRFELMKRFGMTNNEAERITKSLLTESRDLLISLRPADIRTIALGIIQLIQQFDDVTIIYGIRNNPALIKELRAIIFAGG